MSRSEASRKDENHAPTRTLYAVKSLTTNTGIKTFTRMELHTACGISLDISMLLGVLSTLYYSNCRYHTAYAMLYEISRGKGRHLMIERIIIRSIHAACANCQFDVYYARQSTYISKLHGSPA